MSDDLHRLAFEYRNARDYPATVAAYKALEAYEATIRVDAVRVLRGALTAMEVLADFTEGDPVLAKALPGLPWLIREANEVLSKEETT